jgi:exodeoxyribonuclease VII small subunit
MEQEVTYSEAIKKIKSIYGELESGGINVDILAEKIKEASRLIKVCKDKLYKVDENVKKTIEKCQGTP